MAKLIGINEWTTKPDINNIILPDEPTRLDYLRKSAECHRMVRYKIQNIIKPNMKLADICQTVESEIVNVFGKNNLEAGIAFPTGISINNCICHDTCDFDDKRTLGANDICKLDFGTHINGNIIDCAFSIAFNPEYDSLIKASQEATRHGIKMAGDDACIYDISTDIKEIIESHECAINNKTYQIKSVKDIGGHNIEPYVIHAGKLVLGGPVESGEYKTSRMKANEQWAIETFATTGTGMTKQNGSRINHLMLNTKNGIGRCNSKLKITQQMYSWIRKTRSTLAFCPRWYEQETGSKTGLPLKQLLSENLLTAYPALDDIKNSLTSHMEHTIFIKDNGTVEQLSVGDDY